LLLQERLKKLLAHCISRRYYNTFQETIPFIISSHLSVLKITDQNDIPETFTLKSLVTMYIKSSCTKVTTGNVLKVSTQMYQGNLCTFMQIADNTKLEGEADRPDACAAIQRDADKLEKWPDKNLAKQTKMPNPQPGEE